VVVHRNYGLRGVQIHLGGLNTVNGSQRLLNFADAVVASHTENGVSVGHDISMNTIPKSTKAIRISMVSPLSRRLMMPGFSSGLQQSFMEENF
jgi:hypothetical protein